MESLSPLVSVVMPVRNEAAFIKRSLEAVLAQNYPHERIEIIVADGMSTDSTREIVQSIQARHADCNLLLINNPGKIAPAGLNVAIAQAQGAIIVRVDGHCEIAQDYIKSCVKHLLNDSIECVGGPIETMGETTIGRIIAVALRSPFGVGGATFRTANDKTLLTDSVIFPAYRRTVIERFGHFNEGFEINEDDEYNYRLRKGGGKILLAADVRSIYYCRSSFRSLCRQYLRYGFWKVRVMQEHPLQMQPRQFVPAFFVTILLLSFLTAPFSYVSRLTFVLTAGAYMIANLGVSLWLIYKFGSLSLLLLPLAFITLHLSYGLGFLVGLVRYIVLTKRSAWAGVVPLAAYWLLEA